MAVSTVRLATAEDVGPAAGSLARAFEDDPVMAILFPDPGSRLRRIERFFRAGIRHQHLPHGTSYTTEDRSGAALWDPPGHWKMTWGQILRGSPDLVGAFGARVPTALRVLSAMERVHPTEPHYYLAVLGTDPARQGQGIGGALLQPVLDRCDEDGTGAYLESSKERNIPYYRRFGFELSGEIALPRGGMVWPMWREPQVPEI